MRIWQLLIIAMIFASPAFAGNFLNVTGTSLAPPYINSRTPTAMLNLSLNVTDPSGSIVNITSINITFYTSSGTPLNLTNISSVDVRNSTLIFGSNNSINITVNNVTVSFPNGIVVNGTQNRTVWIFVNVSSSATLALNFSINITSNYSIYTADASDNFTVFGGSSQSQGSQVQDLHANISVSPRLVDTNVTNQTFIINITPLGRDVIKNITITLPVGYNITNITSVKQDGSELAYAAGPTVVFSFRDNIAQVNKTGSNLFSSSGHIIINMTANTNGTAISSSEFAVRFLGANLTGVAPDVLNNNTNVTTASLISVYSTQVSKGAAVVNGTDYWEFNITINISQTVTGMLQFKMTNWSGSNGINLALTNGTDFYASLRNQSVSNNSTVFNAMNDYNITQGIQYTNAGPNNLITVFLRMVIPVGTSISNSWQSTFNMLLRATP
ncbi:MAG: hypothetical protein HY513_05020 [Candidatus Aenigmarchaeota archaeon]|nr:hypothetical protein [Candidatus Aenigmarchaeota archaeon]